MHKQSIHWESIIALIFCSCLALKLNDENMSIVLKKAGIVDDDWQDVAHALDLTQSFGTAGWLLQKGKNLLGFQCWTEVLNKWHEQGSPVSWDKLADALQKKYGVDATQTILELSGEGSVWSCDENLEVKYYLEILL